MPEIWEYKYRIKRFYRFDNEEIKGFILSVLVLGFIWAYNDGMETFQFANWFGHYMNAVFMFALALFVHITAQKFYGIYHGYYVEYKYWLVGLVMGVIATLLTNGWFPLLIPGGMTLMHLTRLRIGYFRFGLNTWQASQTALAGPFANVFLVMIMKFFVWQVVGYESAWVDEFFKLNLIFAVYMMLPIPPLPGIIAFFGSKLLYVYSFALMLMYILLILIFDYYSLILGAILGAIIYAIYYWTVERD